MAFSFRSIGHFFAVAFRAVEKELPVLIGTKATVEAVTNAIPGAAAFIPVEDIAYSLLGEISSILTAGGAAAKAKLADAGLDVNVVTNVESLLATAPQLVAVAKNVTSKPATPAA
jgi:hypothetical protein